jgi:alanine racemase
MTYNPSTATVTAPQAGAGRSPMHSDSASSSSSSSWVEVSLAALHNNFRAIQSQVGPEVIVCPVIKSDAYGHGAIGCALGLRDAGAGWFAVSTTEEGVALRKKGILERVLVLSGFWPGEEEELVRYRLTPAVWERGHIELLEKSAQRIKPQHQPAVHLKINTGMNRLGADRRDLEGIFETLRLTPHVFLEGIFSHYASSEVVTAPDGDEQLRDFRDAVAMAERMGLDAPLKHMANSAALVSRPQAWFNLVRPGLAVYGYSLPLSSAPKGVPMPAGLSLQPALAWKSRVLQVREVPAGEQIGYSRGHITQSRTRVAIVPVGYGDGLNRRLSSRGRMIVRDAYARILGNVSMNLTALDVTTIAGVSEGDEVVVLGRTPSCEITAWEHANLASTIPYEILCNISGRLERKYVA